MRLWAILFAIVMLVCIISQAKADRLEDIQARVSELAQQRMLISNEILRLEGAFRERQAVMAEEKAVADLAKAVEEKVEPEVKE